MITKIENRPSLDERNRRFWEELCGTALVRQLGIRDSSLRSLQRLDDWYFAFYPYLERHIPFAALAGQRVLEVGLGYDSMGQRLASIFCRTSSSSAGGRSHRRVTDDYTMRIMHVAPRQKPSFFLGTRSEEWRLVGEL